MSFTTKPSTSMTGFTLIGLLAALCFLSLFSLVLSSLTHTYSPDKLQECLNNLDQHGKMMQSFHMNFGFYPPINGKGKEVEGENWALYMRQYEINGTRWKKDGEYPGEMWYCPALGGTPPNPDPTNGTYQWPDRPCPPSYPNSITSGRDRFSKAFPDSAPIVSDQLPEDKKSDGNHGSVMDAHNVLIWEKNVMQVTHKDEIWKEVSCFAVESP